MAPVDLVLHDVDTWQLIINTVTTIITFLMVALIQNRQTRSDQALQHKVNAVAAALANFMSPSAGNGDHDVRRDVVDLRAAVGLVEYESTSHNAQVP